MANKNDSVRTPRNRVTPEEEAFVALQRAADVLMRELGELLKVHDVSPTQYNVLRILRGSADGLPCGEIGERMITRDPDITRLLDRMEKRGLISRSRDAKDRRIVCARITPAGLKLLAGLDQPVRDEHIKQFSAGGRERLIQLVKLLDLALKT
jgi:DNA-binding MarR family transcriptional regulator